MILKAVKVKVMRTMMRTMRTWTRNSILDFLVGWPRKRSELLLVGLH